MALAAVTPVPGKIDSRPAEPAIEVAYAGAGLHGTADTGFERRCRCLAPKGRAAKRRRRCSRPPGMREA